jgi:hypothetical protein
MDDIGGAEPPGKIHQAPALYADPVLVVILDRMAYLLLFKGCLE